MAGLKEARANALLDIETGVSPSENRWLALYTVAPTATTNGTEVTGGSYARQTIAFSGASAGADDNSADVTFPAATADWGTIVAWAVCDAVSGGSQRFFKALSATKVVTTGDVVKVLAGEIDVSLS